MDYAALIKRAKKAIAEATSSAIKSKVHIVKTTQGIDHMNGLVVVLHPDYVAGNDVRNNKNNALLTNTNTRTIITQILSITS